MGEQYHNTGCCPVAGQTLNIRQAAVAHGQRGQLCGPSLLINQFDQLAIFQLRSDNFFESCRVPALRRHLGAFIVKIEEIPLVEM